MKLSGDSFRRLSSSHVLNDALNDTLTETETTDISSEKGASMLEYSLLAVLIAVVCIAAVTLIGSDTSVAFSRVASVFP